MKAQWQFYFQYALPIIVPLIVSQAKKLVSGKPQLYWLIPASAPVIGALVDFLQSFVTNTALGPQQAAILGAVGVFLREMLVQVKSAVTDEPNK